MTEFSPLDQDNRDALYERAKQVLINAAIAGDVVRRAAQKVMDASTQKTDRIEEPQ